MSTEQVGRASSNPEPDRLPPYFWDLLFVLVLPIVCFALDPIVFGDPLSKQPTFNESIQVATYVGFGFFVVSFFATYLPMATGFAQRYLSGTLLAGGVVALLIGLWLLPLSLIGLLLIIGVLGFTPFGTALRFWFRFRDLKLGKPNSTLELFAVLVGFAFPFVIPVLLQQHGQAELEKVFSAVQASESDRVRKSISELDKARYCGTHCQAEIVSMFVSGKITLTEPEFAQLFKAGTGDDYQRFLAEVD